MLDNRADADDDAYYEASIENPGPFLISKRAQEQEKEREVQPRPHAPHTLEIAEQAVIAGGRKKCRQECRADKRDECPKNRLEPQIQLFATETKSPPESKGRNPCYHAEENVRRA